MLWVEGVHINIYITLTNLKVIFGVILVCMSYLTKHCYVLMKEDFKNKSWKKLIETLNQLYQKIIHDRDTKTIVLFVDYLKNQFVRFLNIVLQSYINFQIFLAVNYVIKLEGIGVYNCFRSCSLKMSFANYVTDGKNLYHFKLTS